MNIHKLDNEHEEATNLLKENREIMDKLADYLIQKETITGKEFMEIYCKEKGIPVPEPKAETMRKERAAKEKDEGVTETATEEKNADAIETAAEDSDDAQVTSSEDDTATEEDVTDDKADAEGTSESDEEYKPLSEKDADFANELKNRLYK